MRGRDESAGGEDRNCSRDDGALGHGLLPDKLAPETGAAGRTLQPVYGEVPSGDEWERVKLN
jgi:hypothetical protein